MAFQLETPVLFLIFNRPEPTKRVLDCIAKVRPKRLLVVADGPRDGHPTDAANCQATRALLDQLSWDCEVIKEFSDVNLGCKRRVSTGLDWAFGLEEKLIILEDDCLPADSFFPYCQEMLRRYEQDDQVMMVAGSNLICDSPGKIPYSYSFSRWAQIWGWATWRRAWKRYDVRLADWPEFRESGQFKATVGDRFVAHYWSRIFEKTYQGKVDTWDHQWSYAMLRYQGLSVQPHVNLVTNIGFGAEATHTKTANGFDLLPVCEMKFPLVHPPGLWIDEKGDRALQQRKQSLARRMWAKVRGYI